MLSKIKITNNTNTPFSYFSCIPALHNGRVFEFTPDVNIIIGPNGSGKTTLLKAAAMYGLSANYMESTLPEPSVLVSSDISKLWKPFTDKFCGGIKVIHDYKSKFYQLKPVADYKGDDALLSFQSFENYFTGKNSSVGESTIVAINSLFRMMFSQEAPEAGFPIPEIEKMVDRVNDIWSKRFKTLLNYYNKNRYLSEPGQELKRTVLMDEPDRNLDIDNIREVYGVLSFNHPQIQLIAVIHNPVLIYKLSKQPGVNIIEMVPGYKDKVVKFVEENS